MLVLTRKQGESVRICDQMTVTVLSIHGGKRGHIRLGFDAPEEMPVMRSELLPAENSSSTKDTKDTKEKRGGVK